MDEEKEFKKLKDAVESGDPEKQGSINDFATNLASNLLSKFKNMTEKTPPSVIKVKHIPTPDVNLSLLFEAPPEAKEETAKPIQKKAPMPTQPIHEKRKVSVEEKTPLPIKKEPTIVPSSYTPKKEAVQPAPVISQSNQSFTDVLKEKLSTESASIKKSVTTEKASPSIESSEKLKKKPIITQEKEKPKSKVTPPKQTVAAAKKMVTPKEKADTKNQELKLKKKSGDLLENRFKKRQQSLDDIIKGDTGSISSKSI
ncbi:hypothetical protein HOG98_07540 [bacterium]|jgi:hypothetical protein|nr:hypothetical protein [bacterium]